MGLSLLTAHTYSFDKQTAQTFDRIRAYKYIERQIGRLWQVTRLGVSQRLHYVVHYYLSSSRTTVWCQARMLVATKVAPMLIADIITMPDSKSSVEHRTA